jgi:hypothetical protein
MAFTCTKWTTIGRGRCFNIRTTPAIDFMSLLKQYRHGVGATLEWRAGCCICLLLTVKCESACAYSIDLAHDVTGQKVGASLRIL